MTSVQEQMEVILRGTAEVISEEELEGKIERSLRMGKPLTVKQGFDPTAPDIHIGHTVSLRKLRQFQDLGHKVVFLIGDFTGMIGDPSGRSEMRKRLSRQEVLQNARTYQEQVFKILDPERTVVAFNSEWCEPMKFEDVLVLASRYTVARMLERDDFSQRYKQGKPITIMEFLYPLIQAYDSVALKADVEVGGTDQKFNLLVGRDVQREYGQEPQVALMMPLLVGTDGKEKMSKSLGNYIGINEPPEEIYGKTMSIPDFLIYPYFELATDVDSSELAEIKRSLEDPEVNPMDLKRRLARRLVAMYHGEEAAKRAEEAFDKVFRRREVPDEVPEYVLNQDRVWIVRLLTSSGLASSNSEARRLIAQGGVYIDGRRVTDPNLEVEFKGGEVVKVGKRRFLRVVRR
ncbi:MAG: tyrosine--tRNA ligase [Candidatus Latescibacterota bacterium]|nr:MAG: tyrosine--tRNA ligase [Candidatus Latescibacterota bacterium]HDH99761.1 tyrosine--tRNA ligase [Bacillota bacterium]